MTQRIVNVRVRPARAAILIDKSAAQQDLLLAFEFFSRIWGGRFGQLLPVDPASCDDLTRFRLDASRPEFVYGIGLDDKHWAREVRQACQARGYGRLQPEFVHGINQSHPEDYYLVDHALLHLFQTRDQHKSRKQTLRLVSSDDSSPWAAFGAAVFGIHHRNLRKDLFDEEIIFTANTATSFIDLITEFVQKWQQSWLDVTGHELNAHVSGYGPLVPTIVLVGCLVPDLSLFWNLRTASDTIHPAWIIPVPFDASTEPLVLERLKEWLLAFLPYGPRPNYCLVTSQTVGEEACRDFGERFRAALGGSPIEVVDYEPPRNRLPIVVASEYETPWAVDITGRKLTLQPPKPKAFEGVDSVRSWFVDLVKDIKTDRAVKDLYLPPSHVVFELLNGPCPPGFERSAIPRNGNGTESINVRCSGSKDVVSLHLPTGEEILEEILREHGVEPVQDEKRSSYLPVIRRFGGLHFAAEAFSGKSGVILTALESETKTLREIKGSCRLGDGVVPGESYLDRIERMLDTESERTKRIGRRRFAQYAKNESPENLRLASVLEFWADRAVLTREWKIGPCSKCNKSFFESRLDIQKRILCPACGNRIGLPEAVPLGYSLNRSVRLAMREGIVPVVLTGRFLRQMTHRGFLWLPGVKYKIGENHGDIDLLACCDSRLVFCECKRLGQIPAGSKAWEDVIAQFVQTASVAKQCGGSLVVLAAQIDKFPEEVRNRIADEIGTRIPHLLLDKQDLETGHRDVSMGGQARPLGFYDLIPTPFPEQVRRRSDKHRTIDMGWGVSYG
jgi:hypothetical protein